MFNEFSSQSSMAEIISEQDARILMNYWEQSPELQEEIASLIYLLKDEKSASEFCDFLYDRFSSKVDPLEKDKIISALGNIGAQNLFIEKKATHTLACLDDEAKTSDIIEAFGSKTMRSKEFIEKDPDNYMAADILKTGISYLMNVFSKSSDVKIRKAALVKIWRGAWVPEFRDQVVDFLKEVLNSENREESEYALSGLLLITQPDQTMIDKLIEMTNAVNWQSISKTDIEELIIMIGHSKSSQFIPFLDSVEVNFKGDYSQIIDTINWAKKACGQEGY